ncbi:uncharacterized protein N7459_002293 [Penicillium hispanicum]|uniref:uncharacterized protein n=1 Tax=Penicillium hispanicum TaxID=1080232 RepID=UPI0025408387|nr:uncharacterized protein N7459_002293 [Penicillium hispanicum]KAJ5591924.1 hypothetical protein N7459_002293 [Penicillium hispanicum]
MGDINWKADIGLEPSIPQIDWGALKDYAISIKYGPHQNHLNPSERRALKCEIPPIYSMGGLHLVRLLAFEDGVKWVARIQLQEATPDSKSRLLSEMHTLSLIRERTDIPVPKVFGYYTCQERVGRVFMIMEFIPGSTAMNAFSGPEAHTREIPPRYKAKFYNDIADIQATMASIRFPKIGLVSQLEDGSYDIGPVPGLGGPFETAQEYFTAWAQAVRFSTGEDAIRSQVPPDLADGLILSIRQFPTQFKEALNRLSISTGPFPLYHPDFYHSNIIIDNACNILSVIDWDGAGTVPWEVVQFPMFLYTVPPPIDLPSKYDHKGYPVIAEIQERWKERREYVECVKEAEGKKALDSKLSTILASHEAQNLATSIRLYKEDGKVGYYCRLLRTTDAR